MSDFKKLIIGFILLPIFIWIWYRIFAFIMKWAEKIVDAIEGKEGEKGYDTGETHSVEINESIPKKGNHPEESSKKVSEVISNVGLVMVGIGGWGLLGLFLANARGTAGVVLFLFCYASLIIGFFLKETIRL